MSSAASHLVEVDRGALVGEGAISPAGLYVVGLRCQRTPVSLGQLRVECHLCPLLPFPGQNVVRHCKLRGRNKRS